MKHLRRNVMSLLTVVAAGLVSSPSVYSQEKASMWPEGFSGKPRVQIFTDYTLGMGDANDTSGYNLTRAFLGYEMNMPLGFSAMIRINTKTEKNADTGKTEYETYLKNLQLKWQYEQLTLTMGLVNIYAFDTQESAWGHRHIKKSFIETQGFGVCDDIGLLARYDVSKYLTLEASMTNGEGATVKNENNKSRYGTALVIHPWTGVTAKVYGEYLEAEEGFEDQQSFLTFLGYKNRYFSIAGEYDWMWNTLQVDGHHRHGFSFSATGFLSDEWAVFGRYDQANSSAGWNHALDGRLYIAGVDYKPIKWITFTPNVQWQHTETGDDLVQGLVSLKFVY